MMRWMPCLICLLIAAAPACAQSPQKQPYVQFPIDKNVEDIVKARLTLDKDLGPFKDLVRQVLTGERKIDPKLAANLRVKLQDEKLEKAIQQWLRTDPDLRKDLSDFVDKTRKEKPKEKELTKSLDKLEELLKETPPLKSNPTGKTNPAKEAAKAKEDPLAKAIQKGMKEAENSQLGEWLKNSPAWKRAFEDLQASLVNPKNGKLGDWMGKLLRPDSNAWKLGEETLERLRQLPRPHLSEWKSKVPMPGLDSLPNFGPPAAPNLPGTSLPRMSNTTMWLLLAMLCVLTVWQMLRWSRRPVAALERSAGLGPWPVKPSQIATRAELVQAFDYLALLTLGVTARTWHHGIIARRWAEQSPALTAAATALAALYEQARYTAGPAVLPVALRDHARQLLSQLAETA